MTKVTIEFPQTVANDIEQQGQGEIVEMKTIATIADWFRDLLNYEPSAT